MDEPKKRRFRFSLRTLLFGVTAFAACLAWWVTWPQRNAQQLVDLMATAPEKAEEMSGQSGMWAVLAKYDHDRPYYEAQPRSIADTLLGKQTFIVAVPTHEKEGDGLLEFTGTLLFERGKLRGPIELDSRVWQR
jgi:hypothetical protein